MNEIYDKILNRIKGWIDCGLPKNQISAVTDLLRYLSRQIDSNHAKYALDIQSIYHLVVENF